MFCFRVALQQFVRRWLDRAEYISLHSNVQWCVWSKHVVLKTKWTTYSSRYSVSLVEVNRIDVHDVSWGTLLLSGNALALWICPRKACKKPGLCLCRVRYFRIFCSTKYRVRCRVVREHSKKNIKNYKNKRRARVEISTNIWAPQFSCWVIVQYGRKRTPT